ncbi:MAG TPA: hypothetical protein VFZ91_13605 [Allosphingosinicella sp.]
MAAGQLSPRLRERQSAAKPSRRAVLGAAVALPLVGGIGSEIAPPPAFACGYGRSPSPSKLGEDWEAALAAFEATAAKVRAIEAATAGCGFDEEEALLPAHEAACEAMEAALGRLLLVPVPDLAAFAAKLELFFDHELEPYSVEAPCLAAIRGDARRLSPIKVVP